MCRSALLEFIRQLEICTQSNVEVWYDQFCNLLILEMDKCQPRKSNQLEAYRRCSKPYWNSHLKKLWNERKMAERNFLRCTDHSSRQQLKNKYRYAQLLFDKNLQSYKRKFWRGQSLRFDYLQTNNPQQFWKELNKLGPRRLQKIPMEVVLSNNTLETRKELLPKKWEQDFADLFSGFLSCF